MITRQVAGDLSLRQVTAIIMSISTVKPVYVADSVIWLYISIRGVL